MKHIVGFSGGIDSQEAAARVIALYGHGDTILMNSDAGGNEDPLTVDFIDRYSNTIHPVVRVHAIVSDIWLTEGFAEKEHGLDGSAILTFKEMIRIKKRPPSRKVQFCTAILKLAPQKRWMAENFGIGGQYEGEDYERYTGVRRDESHARRNYPDREWDEYFDCFVNHIIAGATKDEWEVAGVRVGHRTQVARGGPHAACSADSERPAHPSAGAREGVRPGDNSASFMARSERPLKTSSLNLAAGLVLPIDIASQTLCIFGIRGSGKTNSAGALAEELLDRNQPIAVIDPTDAWWGLRAGRDGSDSAGYPVIIFGGSHADVPLNEADGKVIAEFIVRDGVSVILSLRHLRKGAQRRFVTDFCEEIYHLKGQTRNRTPLTVFIDEAPLFIPQKVMGEVARTVGAVEDLVARGRNAGFGVVLISQRSATINADVRTQADTIICHRVTAALDRKAIEAWFEENASVDDLRSILKSLATLKNGEGWIWCPSLGIMSRVQMRLRKTFDSSATPKIGQTIRAPKKLADIDIEKLKSQMTEALEERRANDPTELRRRIAELERKAPVPVDVDTVAIEREAEKRGHKKALDEYARLYGPLVDRLRLFVSEIPKLLPDPSEFGQVKALYDLVSSATVTRSPVSRPSEAAPLSRPKREGYNGPLPRGELAVLTAACQFKNGVSRKQLTVLTGYKRSSRDAYIQRLREKGIVDASGERVVPIDSAVKKLGYRFDPLPTGRALQEHLMRTLPVGEKAILEILIQARGDPVDRTAIDSHTGYKRSSRDAYIQRLLSRELVVPEGTGRVRASAELF